ncbi:hypothetical protein F6X37_35195 [Paraburkholderia sp. 31.1]|uniref:MerR family transcriptional regulator n=1 Tax=Paraburkholderia sp. 31.1 TaxID=2615205 RepID=UPI001655BD88|nr:MerR family transcriptional regulator [Paraburkholderia sp. 31.1]MBC8726563.1 hypothetical protein [Paraburkholderia sp. 31.1]
MKLSPHQVRAVVGLSEQTLRYWKKAFPTLSGRRGYGPCYTFGEVLALMVVRKLVEQLGTDVAKLCPLVEQLFRVCDASVALLTYKEAVAVLDLETMTVALSSVATPASSSGMLLTVPLYALARDLQLQILASLGGDELVQMDLAFGPTPITTAKKIKEGSR